MPRPADASSRKRKVRVRVTGKEAAHEPQPTRCNDPDCDVYGDCWGCCCNGACTTSDGRCRWNKDDPQGVTCIYCELPQKAGGPLQAYLKRHPFLDPSSSQSGKRLICSFADADDLEKEFQWGTKRDTRRTLALLRADTATRAMLRAQAPAADGQPNRDAPPKKRLKAAADASNDDHWRRTLSTFARLKRNARTEDAIADAALTAVPLDDFANAVHWTTSAEDFNALGTLATHITKALGQDPDIFFASR